MTLNKIKKVGTPTVKALKEFNAELKKVRPTKAEEQKRLMEEAKSSVDIEYPKEDIYGITS